jgi:hypothetical protein
MSSNFKLVRLQRWALGALVGLLATAQPAPAQLAPPLDVDAPLGEPAPAAALQQAPSMPQSGMMNTGFAGHPGLWQPGQGAMGDNPNPVPASFQPGGSHHNKFPKFNPHFWKSGTMNSPTGQATNYVTSGTVLSAILEQDLSSRTCKNGDVFSLTLQDGFVVGGRMAIAPHSKILGTVVNCIPAKMQRHGHPGSLEISLQTLVLPDGSHMPFYGFVEHNPNHLFEKPHKKRWAGVDIRDYGDSVKGMFATMFSGPGWIHARRLRGNEFLLGKGEVLPVRLTRGLRVPEVQVAVNLAPPVVPANVAEPGAQNGSGASAHASGGVPGLADNNEIFNTPLQPSPTNQLPEPF